MKTLTPLLAILLLAACGKKETVTPGASPSAGKPTVYTTFYPTQYFTQRIAGDFADVVCPVPADEDAIFWKPDADAISRYQQADLIVLNGAGFAKWVSKANLPASRVVDTAKSFESEFITYETAVVHQHGDKGAHSHEGVDGHTWVDPVNARTQARAILDALVKKWPEQKSAFESGFASLDADLASLEKDFGAISNDKPLLASHPAYNYIARRYQWKMHNLDLDPEEMPSEETFATIRKTLETFPAKVIVWEGEPTEEIVSRFQSDLGLKSHVFSPCELAPDSGDYLSVMKANLATMRQVFAE